MILEVEVLLGAGDEDATIMLGVMCVDPER